MIAVRGHDGHRVGRGAGTTLADPSRRGALDGVAAPVGLAAPQPR